MQSYYVYILTNTSNTTVYAGVTNDLVRRIYEHQQKLISGFTSKYNLTKLVYYEQFQDIEIAIQREKQIKGWVRRKKDNLIEEYNPNWEDLSSTLV